MAIFEADGKNAIHDGIEHESGGGKGLLDPTDVAILLLDHQAGLFQTVKDIPGQPHSSWVLARPSWLRRCATRRRFHERPNGVQVSAVLILVIGAFGLPVQLALNRRRFPPAHRELLAVLRPNPDFDQQLVTPRNRRARNQVPVAGTFTPRLRSAN